MGRPEAHFLHVHSAAVCGHGLGAGSPTAEQVAISDTLVSDTVALSADESLVPEPVFSGIGVA